MNLSISKMISEDEIQTRVKALGEELTAKFKGKDLLAICVLKGSIVFYSDLIREIDTDLSCDFLGVSSYHGKTQSSGEVKLTLDLNTPIDGRHVLIVEDIVDTGLTMAYLQKSLLARSPASLSTVSLLHKPDAKKVECEIDYIGFEIPNDFVVGYGLDYQGLYRNLPYIGQVSNLN